MWRFKGICKDVRHYIESQNAGSRAMLLGTGGSQDRSLLHLDLEREERKREGEGIWRMLPILYTLSDLKSMVSHPSSDAKEKRRNNRCMIPNATPRTSPRRHAHNACLKCPQKTPGLPRPPQATASLEEGDKRCWRVLKPVLSCQRFLDLGCQSAHPQVHGPDVVFARLGIPEARDVDNDGVCLRLQHHEPRDADAPTRRGFEHDAPLLGQRLLEVVPSAHRGGEGWELRPPRVRCRGGIRGTCWLGGACWLLRFCDALVPR